MPVVLQEGTVIEQFVTAKNLGRQYDFLDTSFRVWQSQSGLTVDHRFICELNFYAVQYLSSDPGHYREADVVINNARHDPPPWRDVRPLMDEFVPRLTSMYGKGDPIAVAAYALWRINWIHPFMQGNGRTARALSYFVLCQDLNLWLPGTPIIPEQIRASRPRYYEVLHQADQRTRADGMTDLSAVKGYLATLLTNQLKAGES